MVGDFMAQRDAVALADLMRQTFGPACRIASCQTVKHEIDYTVLIARLEHPELRVVIKLAGQMAALPSPFDRSAAIIRLVRTHTNVPNSGVIAADVSYGRWPWRYMISTYQPGQSWHTVRPHLNPAELRDAYHQIGEAVATLHGIPFTQFGDVAPDGTVPFGQPYIHALTERARRRIPNRTYAERFISLLRDHTYLFAEVTEPRLTHEDLNPNNILFTNDSNRWELSGILDYESAWAGGHESDLARLEFWRGMTGDGFWEGYTTILGVSPTYAQRRLFYQLLWCLEYNRDTPQHISDTRRVCLALGIAPEEFLL